MSQDNSNKKEPSLAELLSKIKAPKVQPPTVPDFVTKSELGLYDRAREQALLNNFLQDMELRKKYAGRLFWLMVVYLFVVFTILIGSSIESCPMKLGENVLITLLTTTTANMLGLFIIVAKYIFHKRQ